MDSKEEKIKKIILKKLEDISECGESTDNKNGLRRDLGDEVMLASISSWVSFIKKNIDKIEPKRAKNAKYVSPFHPKYLKKLGELSKILGISESDLKAKYKLAEMYRNKLIQKHQKLVLSIVEKFVERYQCKHIKDVLYNIGLEGLTKAIENYEPIYKASLKTYAYPKIQSEIQRAYFREAYTVDLPIRMPKTTKEMEKVKHNIQRFKNQAYLSEKTFENNENTTLSDTKIISIFGEYSKPAVFSEPEEVLMDMERADIINRIMEKLKPDERELLDYLFGLSRAPLSISEYARMKKITTMTVFRRKKAILEKIRQILTQEEGINLNSLNEFLT